MKTRAILAVSAGIVLWLLFSKKEATAGAGSSVVPANVLKWLPQAEAAQSQGDSFISVDWILAVIWQESAGVNGLRGAAGEIGLMQILPGTAAGLGLDPESLWDPLLNIMAGARVLADCMKSLPGSPGWSVSESDVDKLVFQCYNAGADDIGDPVKGKAYSEEVYRKLLSVSGHLINVGYYTPA